MSNVITPKGYKPLLNLKQTQHAIKKVKDFFERDLAIQLNLTRVSAPLFVGTNSGLNDTLNGVERPVRFDIKGVNGEYEIVHSLAKWKRYALKDYGFNHNEGLYTDMNAIRRDEDGDNIHSVLVDQWDWEKIIKKEERNIETFKATVNCIYNALKHTEKYIADDYDFAEIFLPNEIFFITTQELEDMYPDLTPKQREYEISKAKGAVCLMQIGGELKSGKIHDGRAPDYDDWLLNGDLIAYDPIADDALELSSMGIRVDAVSLMKQLEIAGKTERASLYFHKLLLENKLPLTIGGGIGQSRLSMLLLEKAHIGEVQVSVWSKQTIEECKKMGITLL